MRAGRHRQRRIGRDQVAEVLLVRSILTDAASGRTFELFAEAGAPPTDWDRLFAGVTPDAVGALDDAATPIPGHHSTTDGWQSRRTSPLSRRADRWRRRMTVVDRQSTPGEQRASRPWRHCAGHGGSAAVGQWSRTASYGRLMANRPSGAGRDARSSMSCAAIAPAAHILAMMHKTNTLVALMIVALALSITGCDGIGSAGRATDEASTPPPRMLSGTITIVASEPGPADEIADTYHSGAARSWYHACQGRGRYGDIREGGSVVVRDGSGDTLGFDGLDHGYYQIFDAGGRQLNFSDVTDEPFDENGEHRYHGQCQLHFYVEVPANPADLYVVKVPHHADLTYSHEELDDLYWHVDVTLE
jgi:hypothetical protein